MRAALIVFDKMTYLDFVGFYDPLTRLKSMNIIPDFEWRILSNTPRVTDDRGAAGMKMVPDGVRSSRSAATTCSTSPAATERARCSTTASSWSG